MLKMTTEVFTYYRLFLIESISYGFRSIISTVVLYSIKIYQFLHRSGVVVMHCVKKTCSEILSSKSWGGPKIDMFSPSNA